MLRQKQQSQDAAYKRTAKRPPPVNVLHINVDSSTLRSPDTDTAAHDLRVEEWVRTGPVKEQGPLPPTNVSGRAETDGHAEAALESGQPPYEGDAALAASVRAQQLSRYSSLNITPSDDNFQSVFRAAPDAMTGEPAPEKANRWSITYEDICAAALPAAGPPAAAAHCTDGAPETLAANVGQQLHEKPANLPRVTGEGDGSCGGSCGAVEQVRAHGGRHRRSASRDEGGFEQVLRPLSLPCTPARDDSASDALTEGCLSGSDLSADEVSDDGSTSLEDMSDGEILTSSPPLALPRPAPKSRGDPRLSLRLYKLVSRSAEVLRTPPKRTKSVKTGSASRPRAPWWLSSAAASPLSAAASSPAASVARSHSRQSVHQPPPIARANSRSADTADPGARLAGGPAVAAAGAGEARSVASYLSAFQAAAGMAAREGNAQDTVRAFVGAAVAGPGQSAQHAAGHSAALSAAAARGAKGSGAKGPLGLQELKLQQLITPLGDASNRSPPAGPGGSLRALYSSAGSQAVAQAPRPAKGHSPPSRLPKYERAPTPGGAVRSNTERPIINTSLPLAPSRGAATSGTRELDRKSTPARQMFAIISDAITAANEAMNSQPSATRPDLPAGSLSREAGIKESPAAAAAPKPMGGQLGRRAAGRPSPVLPRQAALVPASRLALSSAKPAAPHLTGLTSIPKLGGAAGSSTKPNRITNMGPPPPRAPASSRLPGPPGRQSGPPGRQQGPPVNLRSMPLTRIPGSRLPVPPGKPPRSPLAARAQEPRHRASQYLPVGVPLHGSMLGQVAGEALSAPNTGRSAAYYTPREALTPRETANKVEGASPPWTPTGFHTAREDLLDSAAAAEEASQECAAEAHSRHLRALVESLASEERGLFSPLSGAAKRPVVRRLHTDGAGAAQPTEQLAQADAAGFMGTESAAQMDVDGGTMNLMFNISRSPSEKSASGDCDAPAFRNPLYSNRETRGLGSPGS